MSKSDLPADKLPLERCQICLKWPAFPTPSGMLCDTHRAMADLAYGRKSLVCLACSSVKSGDAKCSICKADSHCKIHCSKFCMICQGDHYEEGHQWELDKFGEREQSGVEWKINTHPKIKGWIEWVMLSEISKRNGWT